MKEDTTLEGFLKQTAYFLERGLYAISSQSDVEKLREIIQVHQVAYYQQNTTYIPDADFDKLFLLLSEAEKIYPNSTPSPTTRVGNDLNGKTTVAHFEPMLSLENAFSEEDLKAFDKRIQKHTIETDYSYVVEPKIDGLSISITYEENAFQYAITRGNGEKGDNVSEQVKSILRLPQHVQLTTHGIKKCEIRGEIYISKKDFAQINQELLDRGESILTNPRNAAAGALRLKNIEEVRFRRLSICLYRIVVVDGTLPHQTHEETIQFLEKLGFPTAIKQTRICTNIDQVVEACASFESNRDDLSFEIDGIVIKINDLHLQKRIGETSHHPKWAIAYKLKARSQESTIISVDFQVGRTGAITPVAKIVPVQVAGATISSVSLFNEDFLIEKDIHIHDKVLVERSGDVIPYISQVMYHKRNGAEIKVTFPEACPSCGTVLEKQDASWRCTHLRCKEKLIERLSFAVSKDAFDIRGLGEQLIRKLVEEKIIADIQDIFRLPFDKIKAMEGLGEKSVNNLKLAVEASKHVEMYRILYSLGIRFVGITTAENICKHITDLRDLPSYSIEKLQEIEDIGTKVGVSLFSYFKDEENIARLEILHQLGVELNIRSDKNQLISSTLLGTSFLFTGTLLSFTREQAEKIVEQHGGTIVSGVNKKLNYLIVGEKAGSKLEKAQKINTIQILTEEEFIDFLAQKNIPTL